MRDMHPAHQIHRCIIACIAAGELRPDEGDAFVAGHSIRSQLAAARQQLGYCPQVNLCASNSPFRSSFNWMACSHSHGNCS